MGLFMPWGPPSPGTHGGTTYMRGAVFRINSTLPVKWGYGIGGVLADTARASGEPAPTVNIYGPLGCSELDGEGADVVVQYAGPGSTSTTYDASTRT